MHWPRLDGERNGRNGKDWDGEYRLGLAGNGRSGTARRSTAGIVGESFGMAGGERHGEARSRLVWAGVGWSGEDWSGRNGKAV